MCDLDLQRRRRNATQRPDPPRMPELYMPAMPPLRLIAAVEHRVRRWLDAWRHRRRLRRLLEHDDRMLDDMGHRRDDLRRASGLPLRVNAHQAMRQWREQRERVERRR